jgi:transposase-like protein
MDCPDSKTMAYPLSLRHIEEMMLERGVFDDHATVHRWAIKMVLAAEPEGRLAQSLAD